MENDNKSSEKSRYDKGGYLFVPAGLLIGIGIGLALGNPGAGTMIGLGAGFLAWAVVRLMGRK